MPISNNCYLNLLISLLHAVDAAGEASVHSIYDNFLTAPFKDLIRIQLCLRINSVLFREGNMRKITRSALESKRSNCKQNVSP